VVLLVVCEPTARGKTWKRRCLFPRVGLRLLRSSSLSLWRSFKCKWNTWPNYVYVMAPPLHYQLCTQQCADTVNGFVVLCSRTPSCASSWS